MCASSWARTARSFQSSQPSQSAGRRVDSRASQRGGVGIGAIGATGRALADERAFMSAPPGGNADAERYAGRAILTAMGGTSGARTGSTNMAPKTADQMAWRAAALRA